MHISGKRVIAVPAITVALVLAGVGLVGAPGAFAAPPTAPSAPAGLTATPGNTTAVLSWTAPANGGSAITGYNVYEGTTSGGENYSAAVNGSTLLTGTTDSVTGLTNATTYYFTVEAVNAIGSSVASSEVFAIPAATVPGPPRNLTATPADVSAVVTWLAPTDPGGSSITSYKVTAADSTLASRGGQTCSWTSGALSCTTTGLTNGDSYTFTATATNSLGTGVASSASSAILPAVTAPAAPTGLKATPGNTTAALSWTAPANGGSAITGYNVYEGTASGGENYSAAVNGTLLSGTTYSVTGLTNGTTYYFTVKAVNTVGSSAASNEAWATPATTTVVPGAPTSVVATAGDNSAMVSWASPSSAGSSNITGYSVTAADATHTSGGAQTCTWTTGSLSCTLTGLTNNDSYTFTVTATNSVGTGVASSASNSVVPGFTEPSAVTTLSAMPGDRTVTLSWSAPATGGAPIDGYNLYEGTASGGENYGSAFNGFVLINGTSVTVSGLTNGHKYYFTVEAVNELGSSNASNEVWAVATATVSGAPINVTATAGSNGTATVTWNAPLRSGSSAVVGYVVTPYLGTVAQASQVFNSTAVTETVSGLYPGSVYTFTIAAINASGNGASSAQSNTITVPMAYSTVALLLYPSTVTYGQEQVEKFSVTVSPNYPGPVPAGSVSIKKSTTTLCVIQLSSAKGSCTLTGMQLPTRTYSVYATYSRNANFVGSTSSSKKLTVGKETSKTALKLSATKVTFGHEQLQRFSVTVSPRYTGATPTGSVSVKKSTTTLCVIKLSSGKGSCTLTSMQLPTRPYSVYATYGGDATFLGSPSHSASFTVAK
jgi:predicted RNA-binding protein with TRAM domain